MPICVCVDVRRKNLQWKEYVCMWKKIYTYRKSVRLTQKMAINHNLVNDLKFSRLFSSRQNECMASSLRFAVLLNSFWVLCARMARSWYDERTCGFWFYSIVVVGSTIASQPVTSVSKMIFPTFFHQTVPIVVNPKWRLCDNLPKCSIHTIIQCPSIKLISLDFRWMNDVGVIFFKRCRCLQLHKRKFDRIMNGMIFFPFSLKQIYKTKGIDFNDIYFI